MVVAAPGPRLAVHGTGGSYVKHHFDPQEDALRAGRRPEGERWGMDAPESFGTLTQSHDDALQTQPIATDAGDYPAYYAALAPGHSRRRPESGTGGGGARRDPRDQVRAAKRGVGLHGEMVTAGCRASSREADWATSGDTDGAA